SDCLGTALRQGAKSVTTLAIGVKPPLERDSKNQPWPTHPLLFEVSSSHAEGGEREYLASTVEFLGDEDHHVTALRVATTGVMPDGVRGPAPGAERELPADMVLLAMGVLGPESELASQQLGLTVNERQSFARDDRFATAQPGVFVAGDAGRGQSLIVWAIAEGRAAAASVDRFLMGESALPAPVKASDRAIAL